MRQYVFPLAAALVLLSACTEKQSLLQPDLRPQAAGGPPATTINVTSTVYDNDGAGDLLYTRSDNPGAGVAAYTSSGGVSSTLTANGAWQLFLGNQTVRTLYLVLASQGIPAADDYYYKNVEAFSQCFLADNVTIRSILTMTIGETSSNCSFGVDFQSGKTKYKLAMSPRYAGTGRALVTCNAASNGTCTNWKIEVDANAANAGVANLFEYAKNGSLILKGTYSDSYLVVVNRP